MRNPGTSNSNADLEQNLGYAPLRKKKAPRFDTPVRVVCTHYRVRNFDLDNGSVKAVLDQIVRAGILADDSTQQITEITHKFVKAGNEKTVITITEV